MEVKSKDNWKAGRLCLDNSLLNAAANRFYYSIFQAVLLYMGKRYGYIRKEGDRIHKDMINHLKKDGEATDDEIETFIDFLSLRTMADYKPATPPIWEIKDNLYKGENLRDRYLNKAKAT